MLSGVDLTVHKNTTASSQPLPMFKTLGLQQQAK